MSTKDSFIKGPNINDDTTPMPVIIGITNLEIRRKRIPKDRLKSHVLLRRFSIATTDVCNFY